MFIIDTDSEVIELKTKKEHLSYKITDLLYLEEVEAIKKQHSETKLRCCENCRSQEEPVYLITQAFSKFNEELGENVCIDCHAVYNPEKLTLHEFYIKTK